MNLTVGPASGDIIGCTNVAIQSALDRISALGGGTLTLLPGVYTCWDGVRIPSRVSLVGSGPETVLRKGAGWEMLLAEDGDYGDEWARCEVLPPVAVGHGVKVSSGIQGGFHSTIGTVLEIDGTRMRISARFNSDYMMADGAAVNSAHPMLIVEGQRDIAISDLVIDGNAAENPRMDGCRGGGIWGLYSASVHIARVHVHHINGDGISFQNSHDWTIEDSTFEDCTGGGMHPGSGSQRPILRNCVSRRNGGWGIFVCWRVKHGLFEKNLLEENRAGGISIGHKDTDDLFRENRILRNAGPGIQTRNETFPMAAHRGTYEGNLLRDNNQDGAQIVLDGETHDLVFRNNILEPAAPGFQVGPNIVNLTIEEPVKA